MYVLSWPNTIYNNSIEHIYIICFNSKNLPLKRFMFLYRDNNIICEIWQVEEFVKLLSKSGFSI